MAACKDKVKDPRIEGIASAIRVVPNFPKPGIMFQGITTLLLDPKAFKNTVDLFLERYTRREISVFAGIEARGFIFGPPIALAIGAKFVPLRKPKKLPGIEARGFIFGPPIALAVGAKFVPLRKPKKLPGKVISEEYVLEYVADCLGMHVGAVQPGERALVVDDLIATGGTLGAAMKLLGIMFQDITTLLLDPKAFKNTVDLFVERYTGRDISVVAGIEAGGFIFGPPIALAIGAKFVPLRNPKKLPGKVISEEYVLEYGADCLGMHVGAVQPGERALVVDDLIATGGTLGAAMKLLGSVRRRKGESFAGFDSLTLETMAACKDKVKDPRIDGIASAICVVPNFPKPGTMFRDITTLLLDPKAFSWYTGRDMNGWFPPIWIGIGGGH